VSTPTQATATTTAGAAVDELDPARVPLPAKPALPTEVWVALTDGRMALVKRRAPRAALKGKVALAKAVGPTIGRILVGGIDVGGQRIEALTLLSLATAKGRAQAAAEGLDVAAIYTVARRSLPQLLMEAIADVDPEGLDPLIEYYLVGATAVAAIRPEGAPESYVKIDDAEQLDKLLPDDRDLAKLLFEAITMGLRPFGVGSSSPPSS
jgi:hypothetical protein